MKGMPNYQLVFTGRGIFYHVSAFLCVFVKAFVSAVLVNNVSSLNDVYN